MELSIDAVVAGALARAAVIAAAAAAAHWFTNRMTLRLRDRVLAAMRARGANGDREKRAGTIAGVAGKAARAVIWGSALLSIPRQFGFDLTPVLAGLGVGGLAVGLGARTFIQDAVSGLFLLAENHIREGDVCEINGQRGAVVEVNLRTTVLRSGDGTVHMFPNGSIRRLANVTRGFSCFLIDLPVSLREDPDRVIQVLDEAATDLARDPGFAPLLLAPLEILGVDRFAASAMVVRARLMTHPGQQMRAGRELNRRVHRLFAEAGIRFAWPATTLYAGEAAAPVRSRQFTKSMKKDS